MTDSPTEKPAETSRETPAETPVAKTGQALIQDYLKTLDGSPGLLPGAGGGSEIARRQ